MIKRIGVVTAFYYNKKENKITSSVRKNLYFFVRFYKKLKIKVKI